MNKRDFIRSAILGGLTIKEVLQQTSHSPIFYSSRSFEGKKFWAWVNPNDREAESEMDARYAKWKEHGIDGIFFEADNEKHFLSARKNGLATHRWMWIMNRPDKALMQNYPEWFAVSRKGQSVVSNPPYVDYYRWLCPNKPEVLNYLEAQVSESVSKPYVDGIHLDYIRYCDVILPVNLWQTYNIKQNAELPEYDFCYCNTCRSAYQRIHGVDPLKLEHPDQSASWRRFRYNSITRVVNHLASTAAEYGKPVSAAVFPTPEIAKRIVRQDWVNWKLDAVFPMIYHGFYRENVQWIGEAVEEGVTALNNRFPLYAGLFLPDFAGAAEIEKGISLALKNGAVGVSLFGTVNDDILKIVKKFAAA